MLSNNSPQMHLVQGMFSRTPPNQQQQMHNFLIQQPPIQPPNLLQTVLMNNNNANNTSSPRYNNMMPNNMNLDQIPNDQLYFPEDMMRKINNNQNGEDPNMISHDMTNGGGMIQNEANNSWSNIKKWSERITTLSVLAKQGYIMIEEVDQVGQLALNIYQEIRAQLNREGRPNAIGDNPIENRGESLKRKNGARGCYGNFGRFSEGNDRSCGWCKATDTPEWRRGPNGPRTLCNACGLKFAKKTKRDPSSSSLGSLSLTGGNVSNSEDGGNSSSTNTNAKPDDSPSNSSNLNLGGNPVGTKSKKERKVKSANGKLSNGNMKGGSSSPTKGPNKSASLPAKNPIMFNGMTFQPNMNANQLMFGNPMYQPNIFNSMPFPPNPGANMGMNSNPQMMMPWNASQFAINESMMANGNGVKLDSDMINPAGNPNSMKIPKEENGDMNSFANNEMNGANSADQVAPLSFSNRPSFLDDNMIPIRFRSMLEHIDPSRNSNNGTPNNNSNDTSNTASKQNGDNHDSNNQHSLNMINNGSFSSSLATNSSNQFAFSHPFSLIQALSPSPSINTFSFGNGSINNPSTNITNMMNPIGNITNSSSFDGMKNQTLSNSNLMSSKPLIPRLSIDWLIDNPRPSITKLISDSFQFPQTHTPSIMTYPTSNLCHEGTENNNDEDENPIQDSKDDDDQGNDKINENEVKARKSASPPGHIQANDHQIQSDNIISKSDSINNHQDHLNQTNVVEDDSSSDYMYRMRTTAAVAPEEEIVSDVSTV